MYIKHVKSNSESVAYQALIYEDANDDASNILQLVRKFTPFFQVNRETRVLTIPTDNNEVKSQNQRFYKHVLSRP